MIRSISVVALVALGACGFSFNTGTSLDAAGSADGSGSGSDDGDVPGDAPDVDAPMIDASTALWNPPQVLGFAGAEDPTLTGDMLQIWFEQNGDIFHAVRLTTTAPFSVPTKVPAGSRITW